MGMIVIIVVGSWIVTGLFIIPVTVALELMICQCFKTKWFRILPALAGVIIAIPAEWLMWAFGTGIHWAILTIALAVSLMGCTIGWYIHLRMK